MTRGNVTLVKAVRLLVSLIAVALLLREGFVFLESHAHAKIVATLFAVVWGVGSVALLFFTLNAMAELLPYKAQRRVLPIVFAGPALFMLVWFLVLPTLRTLWLSLHDDTGAVFVGLDNYVFAFTDAIMLESFLNNLLWMVLGTASCVGMGLLIAILADRSRWEPVFKALIFMPMAISFVGAGVIWKFIYAYQGEGTSVDQIGLLNAVVVAFGGHAQAWLQSPGWNNLLLIVIMVWLQTGYAMVIISAAIKAIPVELVEAARVEGAGAWAIYVKIIIPLIRGSLVTVATTTLAPPNFSNSAAGSCALLSM